MLALAAKASQSAAGQALSTAPSTSSDVQMIDSSNQGGAQGTGGAPPECKQ